MDRADAMAATKKVQTITLLEPEQAKKLQRLHENTRIPKQVLLREAVDDLFVKHKKELRK
jgi:predicted transcriptional regulator